MVSVRFVSLIELVDEPAPTVFIGAPILEKGNVDSEMKLKEQIAFKNQNTNEIHKTQY